MHTHRPAMIHVLIDYNDWLVAAGIAATLELSGEFRLVHPGFGTAHPTLESGRGVDVVIADYETGLSLARAAGGSSPILILTRHACELQIRMAVERGISGYLLLGCSSYELLNSLRTLSLGGKIFSAPVAARLAESVRYRPLTARELTVLSHVVSGRSDKDIGNQLAVSVGTVKTHVKSILAKLGARGRTEAAAIARRRGIFPEEA
jgi:DNA-binding NarL/FixJ family response regulator